MVMLVGYRELGINLWGQEYKVQKEVEVKYIQMRTIEDVILIRKIIRETNLQPGKWKLLEVRRQLKRKRLNIQIMKDKELEKVANLITARSTPVPVK